MLMLFIIIITIYLSFRLTTMKQAFKKLSLHTKIKNWFVQLSFWKKIIIIFTLNTCLLLILTDAIMLVLFGKISNDIIAISNSQKDQFNQVSNMQVAKSTANMVLSNIDIFANILTQLVNTYHYFSQNPQLYTSLETATPPNPKLTSSFPNTSYSEPALYYLNNHSTFTPLPYLDEILPQMITSTYLINSIQRVNIFVLNSTSNDDITARTFPATNSFIIPNASAITDRFTAIQPATFTLSPPYTDILTTSATPSQLFSLRTVFNNSAQNFMIEIEILQSVLSNLVQQIYYFPSTTVVLAQQTNNAYSYFSSTPPSYISANISAYTLLGTNRMTANGVDYVSASLGISNTYQLGSVSAVTNQTSDPIRCIIVVQASETEQPANQIQSFLTNESNILIGIVLSWSFIILLSTVGLATVVGNYIFFNLKMLSSKMEQYIKDPSKFHVIVIELKELQLKGILKKLSDNLIGIIQKIQVRKRQRKDRINQNYHPLSVGEPKFQERQQLNDYQIMDQIKEEVRIKVEAMAKEAEEKQRIQKEKAEIAEKLKLQQQRAEKLKSQQKEPQTRERAS